MKRSLLSCLSFSIGVAVLIAAPGNAIANERAQLSQVPTSFVIDEREQGGWSFRSVSYIGWEGGEPYFVGAECEGRSSEFNFRINNDQEPTSIWLNPDFFPDPFAGPPLRFSERLESDQDYATLEIQEKTYRFVFLATVNTLFRNFGYRKVDDPKAEPDGYMQAIYDEKTERYYPLSKLYFDILDMPAGQANLIVHKNGQRDELKLASIRNAVTYCERIMASDAVKTLPEGLLDVVQ